MPVVSTLYQGTGLKTQGRVLSATLPSVSHKGCDNAPKMITLSNLTQVSSVAVLRIQQSMSFWSLNVITYLLLGWSTHIG